jgi:hypothetical protein
MPAMQTVSSKPLFWGLTLLVLSALSLAQNQSAQNQPAQNQPTSQDSSSQNSGDTGNSLAGAARTAKAQKAGHSKKVFTDEDMEVSTGPLPRLKMDGPENVEEVVTAISTYKLTHTPEQTEQAVHMWFDQYDQILAAAIQQNHDVAALRNANMSNGYALCQESRQSGDYQDYQKCASRQMAEARGAQSDQQEYIKNNNAMMRIQRAFQRVRIGLQMSGLRYTWFRIRTANNIDM